MKQSTLFVITISDSKQVHFVGASPPHSPLSFTKRHWQTAVVMAHVFLAEAKLPKRYWFWATREAVFCMNLSPHHNGPDPKELSEIKPYPPPNNTGATSANATTAWLAMSPASFDTVPAAPPLKCRQTLGLNAHPSKSNRLNLPLRSPSCMAVITTGMYFFPGALPATFAKLLKAPATPAVNFQPKLERGSL
jgi:hypothetical protein